MPNQPQSSKQPINPYCWLTFSIALAVILFNLKLISDSLTLKLKPNLPIAQAQSSITINAGKTYQTIEGFGVFGESRGGNDRYGDVYNIVVNDLGADIVRLPFPAGFEKNRGDTYNPSRPFYAGESSRALVCFKNQDPNRAGGEYNIADMDVVLGFRDAGARFMVTPWVVPNWVWDSPNRETDYANMMSAFVQHMQSQYGVNIEWLSILNEPDMGVCMRASASEISSLASALSSRFQANGLSTQIIAPEAGAWNVPGNYTYSAVGSPDVFAFHYSDEIPNDPSSISSIRTQVPSNVQIWDTEWGGCEWCGVNTHSEAMQVAVYLHNKLGNGVSAPIFFNGYCGTTNSHWCLMAVDWGSMNVSEYGPKYYSFKQFSRYIKPGSKRIDVSGSPGGVYTSAYLHPDGTLTIVVVNEGSSQSINFSLQGLASLDSIEKIRYSQSEHSQHLGSLNISGNNFSDTLAASSVTTYTTQAGSQPPSQSNVSLFKSSNLSTASHGQEIRYTIHYSNTGQAQVENVVIRDLIPSGTSYVQGSANPTGGQYLTNPARVEWQFNSLASGEQGDVEFEVKVN